MFSTEGQKMSRAVQLELMVRFVSAPRATGSLLVVEAVSSYSGRSFLETLTSVGGTEFGYLAFRGRGSVEICAFPNKGIGDHFI